MIDYFQDMLISLEDGKVSGHPEPLAYSHSNECIEKSIRSEDDTVASLPKQHLTYLYPVY